MIADDPGRLAESNIVVNLNPPCAISDFSWIKPGKTAWDLWLYLQLSSQLQIPCLPCNRVIAKAPPTLVGAVNRPHRSVMS
jgi:hypothetical protein